MPRVRGHVLLLLLPLLFLLLRSLSLLLLLLLLLSCWCAALLCPRRELVPLARLCVHAAGAGLCAVLCCALALWVSGSGAVVLRATQCPAVFCSAQDPLQWCAVQDALLRLLLLQNDAPYHLGRRP